MPRNEWDDDSKPLLSLDEMKYELAKRGTMPLRSDGSDVPYTAAEVPNIRVPVTPKEPPKPYSTSSDFAQVVADRLGISALPQALMAMGTGFASEVAKGMGYKDAAKAIQYEPTSRTTTDILAGLEAAPRAITGSHMGFGPTPELWATSLGRGINADDVRVLAKRGIETGRELRAIPDDFINAQSGLVRQNYKGEPTYGARLQGTADDIGDALARIEARKSEYSTPMSGSVQVFSDMVPDTKMYAVKPTGGQLVKSVDPITGDLRELPNSSVAGISDVYENIRKQTEGQGLINQYLRTFVNRPGVQPIWEDFNAKKVNEEFPGAPTPEQAREAFQVKYPTAKSRNERMTTFFDEFAASPEAQAAASDLGIKIPTFEEYQKRIEAANQWGQKGFANYIQKYVGTKEDPALQLATQGITFKDPARLSEGAVDALNYANPVDLRNQRKAAGFNEEGEIQPFLKEKLTELRAVDDQLREMVTKRNSLYEQARTSNVDPASIPEYAELTNKLASKVAEKERITQQAENYKLGKSYETLSDLSIEPRTAKDLKRRLDFAEKQLFPYLDKTPDEATLYDINPTTIERLGLTELATKFMDDIVSGKIPIEQIGNMSIPKYIQESASARIAKEAAAKKDLAVQQRLLDTYLQEQVQSIPGDKIFGNAGVLEITNAMSEDAIRRHLSADTQALDHCVGQGGRGERGNEYVPMVNPVTGEVPKGSSGENTAYVRRILEKGTKIASFRDLVTGKPVGTLELNKASNGGYDVGYASGYQNGRMQSTYSESLANYLNSIANDIEGSGDNLVKNGVLDKENATRYEMRDVTGLSESDLNQLSFDGLPRFLTRDNVIALNNERKSMLPSAQLNSEVATLNTSYAELLDDNQRLNFDLQNVDDDMLREELLERRGEIRSQLDDIGTRIGNMPIEDITTFARELINDVFPANKTTPRARLQYLENETPTGLRIQPRVYEAMRELLRDERDAVGAPLSPQQQTAVRENWYALSNTIARSINGDTYNAAAIANNIRRNPESYNLGEYNAQMINAIAEMVEQRGIQDPALTTMPRIDRAQSNLPERVVEHINNMLGNAITSDRTNQNAIQALRDAQFTVSNPRPNTIYSDLPQHLRNEAIGELQRGVDELERRAQLPVLRNTAPTLEGVRNAVAERRRPIEQQDLGIVLERLHDAVAEDYGQPVADYVREALATINYNVTTDAPLYIESLRRMADNETEREVSRAMNMIANRLVQGERANVAAARAEREQLPAPRQATLPTPRDIANEVTPPSAAFGAQRSDALTEAINNEIRALPNTDEELHAYVNAINSRPLDLPGPIEMYLVNDGQRNRISDYLIQQASRRIETLQRQAEPREVQDLTGVLDQEMNRIRDNYGEEVYNTVEGTLTAINDNFDIAASPEMFSNRIRHHAQMYADTNNTTVSDALTHAADLLDRTVRENNAIDRRPPAQENGGLTPEYMTYLRTRLADARTGEDMINLERDFLQTGNPQGYSQSQIQAIEREIGQRSNEILRGNQPALRAPDSVGNIVQNLINQYPEPAQIQALINDLEHGEYSELPTALLNADEIVIDDTVSQILEQLEQYRDEVAANQRNAPRLEAQMRADIPRQAEPTDLNAALEDALDSVRNEYGGTIHQRALEVANSISNDVDLTDDPRNYISQLRQTGDLYQGDMQSAIHNLADELEVANVGQAFAQPQLPEGRVRDPRARYGTDVMDAYNGIMADNNDFSTFESLDALRALPQLIRRPGATRQSLGIAAFETERINQLARIFDALYNARYQQFVRENGNNPQLPPPEGRKRGGLIKKQSGGKVEPTSPSSSVDDRSKPVEPVKKIRNPDAPEFKDIFNRERAIRGGTQSSGGSGSSAELKQLMNPRAYANGGSIQSSKNRLLSPNTDEMRYALLKGK